LIIDELMLHLDPREETLAVIGAAHGRYQAFIAMAAFTGLRSSELIALRWQSVSLDAAKVEVSAAITRGKLGPPKSKASRRTVGLPPMLVTILRAWKLASPHSGDEDLVFARPDGEPDNQQAVLKYGLRPALKAAGITKLTGVHDLRRLRLDAPWRRGADHMGLRLARPRLTGDHLKHVQPRHAEGVGRLGGQARSPLRRSTGTGGGAADPIL
jgi:integrase